MRSIVLIFGILLSVTALCEEAPITGVYSTLEYHSQSGDVAGQEAMILPTFSGLKIVIYCGAGVPIAVPLIKTGNIYSFELGAKEEDALCGISKNYVKATTTHLFIWHQNSNENTATKLPRRPSYWVERNRVP